MLMLLLCSVCYLGAACPILDSGVCTEVSTPRPTVTLHWYKCPVREGSCVSYNEKCLQCKLDQGDCLCSWMQETRCDKDCVPSISYPGLCHCPGMKSDCHNSGFLFWKKTCSPKEDGQCYCQGTATSTNFPFPH